MRAASPTVEQPPRIDGVRSGPELLRTLSEQVYRYLHEALLGGALAPGDRLPESGLAERFNVSRTPVRAVLQQLERDGLVVSQPHRGTAVRSFTRTEARELYEVRSVLESAALALVLRREDKNVLVDELRRLARTGEVAAKAKSLQEASVNIDAFHVALVRASGNSLLFEEWRRLWGQTRFLRALAWREHPPRAATAGEEHEQVCDALATGDLASVTRLMAEHIERAWRAVEPVVKPEYPEGRA